MMQGGSRNLLNIKKNDCYVDGHVKRCLLSLFYAKTHVQNENSAACIDLFTSSKFCQSRLQKSLVVESSKTLLFACFVHNFLPNYEKKRAVVFFSLILNFCAECVKGSENMSIM